MNGLSILIQRINDWKCRTLTLQAAGRTVAAFDMNDDGTVFVWTPGSIWGIDWDGGVPFFDY